MFQFYFCFSYGLTSVTTLLSASVLFVRASFWEIEQHGVLFLYFMSKLFTEKGVFSAMVIFCGQTEYNSKHLFYSGSPQQEDICQNCGCEKHFLRKRQGYNQGFKCVLDSIKCIRVTNHQPKIFFLLFFLTFYVVRHSGLLGGRKQLKTLSDNCCL